jgi:antirestriction protein ArdC
VNVDPIIREGFIRQMPFDWREVEVPHAAHEFLLDAQEHGVGANHAAYLQSWLTVLASDKRAIFQAAALAQRAVAFLHGLQTEAEGRQLAA